MSDSLETRLAEALQQATDAYIAAIQPLIANEPLDELLKGSPVERWLGLVNEHRQKQGV